MPTLVSALLSIAISVSAQFCLKTGMSSPGVKEAMAQAPSLSMVLGVLTNRYVLGGFVLYGLGSMIWLTVLAKWDVSKSYPMVGLGFILTLVVGHFMGEQVTPTRIAGALLICSGVFLIGRS